MIGAEGPTIRLAVPTDWQKVFDKQEVADSHHKAGCWTQIAAESGGTVPLMPDGTVSRYGGGGQPSGGAKAAADGQPWNDILPWWIDSRHHGWAPARPPREDQWEDWAI